jgi:quinol monooxygenase YgiN
LARIATRQPAISAKPEGLAGVLLQRSRFFFAVMRAKHLRVTAVGQVSACPQGGQKRNQERQMTNLALYVQLEAKPGMEKEVAKFLSGARRMVEGEPETTAWFAMKMGPRSFGIFDAFANEQGREAHLQGKVAKELMAKAPQLFEKAPEIHRIEILADKLPH